MTAESLSRWQSLLLIIAALAVFAPGQAALPPIDRDETRYIQAAVQMMETGEYVDIRLQDRPRYLQPAGIYWLQVGTVSLFSDHEDRQVWAHRLVSLLGATASVWLTALIGARLFGARVGVMAGLMLCATVLLGVEARLAKTDAMLLATIVLAMYGLLRAFELRNTRERIPIGWAIAFWAALGCGFMIKGPLVLTAPGLAAVAITIWRRHPGWLLGLRPLIGLPIALAIALPWYIAIYYVSDGAFYATSAGGNLLGKLFEGQQGHGAPPGTYLLMAIGTLWPLSQAVVMAGPWIWRQRRVPEVAFCLAWAVPTWLMFEIIVTKLPHYILPTVPALAILAAAAIATLGSLLVTQGRWARLMRWPTLLAFVVVGAGLSVIPAVLLHALEGGFDVTAIAFAVVGLAGMAGATRSLVRREIDHVARTAPLLMLLVFALNMQFVMPRVDTIFFYREIAPTAAAVAPCPDYRVMTAPLDLESVVYLNGTDTALEFAEHLATAMQTVETCAVLFLSDDQRNDLFGRIADLDVTLAYTGNRIDGFNFSNGDWYDLGVYTAIVSTAR